MYSSSSKEREIFYNPSLDNVLSAEMSVTGCESFILPECSMDSITESQILSGLPVDTVDTAEGWKGKEERVQPCDPIGKNY